MLRNLLASEESQELQEPFQAFCVSFSHADVAPFQRLLCTHIGHILAQCGEKCTGMRAMPVGKFSERLEN